MSKLTERRGCVSRLSKDTASVGLVRRNFEKLR